MTLKQEVIQVSLLRKCHFSKTQSTDQSWIRRRSGREDSKTKIPHEINYAGAAKEIHQAAAFPIELSYRSVPMPSPQR